MRAFNRSASEKHAFTQSNIQLNRYFADVERWTIDAIRQRGRHLARHALEIWPDVGRTSSRSKKSVERPRAVRFRGETSSCKTWADGYEQLIRYFDAASPDFLVRVGKDARLSSIVSPSSTRFIRSQFGLKHLYFNKHASAENLQDWLQRIAEAGGIRAEDYEFIHAKTLDR
ncbi:MAG: hypothetical protein SFX72_10240 [Isosphaeraceae bacterium]|nr:hypothetical protein [Isosphaeraceae bacterium]